MANLDPYSFCKVTAADLDLLRTWQARPHVRAWWDADDDETDDLTDPRVARWMVHHAGRPFAYMQDYDVHGWDGHHFANLPKGSRGIDQFIGEPDMVNIGHGTAFIRARLRALFAAGAPAVGTDPHPDNARAIAVYRKVGFAPAGPPQNTPWGLILPMVANRTPETPQ